MQSCSPRAELGSCELILCSQAMLFERDSGCLARHSLPSPCQDPLFHLVLYLPEACAAHSPVSDLPKANNSWTVAP